MITLHFQLGLTGEHTLGDLKTKEKRKNKNLPPIERLIRNRFQ